MVEPKLQNALRNVELTTSMERLVDALPFYHGSPTQLTKTLIETAGDNFHPDRISDIREIPPDIRDLHARIIEYARDVSQHAGTSTIKDEKSLIAEFIWFLTQPLNTAERDVMSLEGRLLADLSHHEALGITNIDFRTPDDARRAEALLETFIERTRTYAGETEALMRRARVLERVFHDPEGIAPKMLNTLYSMSSMITQLEDTAKVVLDSSDNDILRARSLGHLRAIIHPASPTPVPPDHGGRPPSMNPLGSTAPIHGDGSGVGGNCALAGGVMLSGGAQVIPFHFFLISPRPVGKV